MKVLTAEIKPTVSSQFEVSLRVLSWQGIWDITTATATRTSKMATGLDKQNKHSSHAAHFSVHFFTITERPGRENNWIQVLLRT